jgi:hypothetical protein
MTFRIVSGDARGFCVEPGDDADSLAQMFAGETNGVANEEFLVALAVAATVGPRAIGSASACRAAYLRSGDWSRIRDCVQSGDPLPRLRRKSRFALRLSRFRRSVGGNGSYLEHQIKQKFFGWRSRTGPDRPVHASVAAIANQKISSLCVLPDYIG